MTTQFVQDSAAAIAPVMRTDSLTVDAATLFLERQLEVIEQRVYRQKLRPLQHRAYIPVSTRDPEGAESIVYKIFNKIGMAKFISDDADDIPMADAFATRHVAFVRQAAVGFKYSTQELRAAALANVALEVEKADAATRAMEELESETAWKGSAEHDLLGLTNNPNVPQEQVALNQAATSRLWVDKTPQEIIDDVSDFISNIRIQSKNVHRGPYILGMPIAQNELIAKLRITDNFPTKTVREYLLDESRSNGIMDIVGIPEFEGIGPAGSDIMMAWENDSEVLEQRIPMPMRMLPPQQVGLSFKFFLEEELGGVVVRFPLGTRKAYGI